MEITVDIKSVEQFVLSEKFRNFLVNNTTEFSTALFVLQTLMDKIDEIKNSDEQEEDQPNKDKSGEWEINPDGYYLQCPFCKHESDNKDERCASCGANLTYRS